MVAFADRRIQLLREMSPVFDRTVWVGKCSLSALGFRLHREFQIGDTSARLGMEGLSLELLGQLTREYLRDSDESRPPKWLRSIRDKLHADFQEPLTLCRLAETAQVHPVHLGRVFRRVYGLSVGDYLRQLRIEAASKALADTSIPLSQIALDAGFCAQSHFSTVFKQRTGVTPAQYRRAIHSRCFTP
jgi:AraC family transcriptional regulator